MDQRTDGRASAKRLLRGALPPALLLLALASVFVFGNDRSQFYREGTHSRDSADALAVAAHLSAEHGFVVFRRQRLGEDGERIYDDLYHRFPVGSYALVRFAVLPFGDDFPRAIHAARLLMLATFAAAAALAYLSLVRLLGDRWIALAATLLAFSSYYLLHYSDIISGDGITNLFGVMLVFHGMTLFVQEGRFRQLLVKTAVAIPFGWHVVGLIAPFVLLGLGSELLRRHADGGGKRLPALAASVRSRSVRRYVAYGAFSVLCCALMLGFNLGNEYRALGGEVPLHETPSFRAMLMNTGADAERARTGDLGQATFLRGQLGGVGGMAIPFAAVERLGLDLPRPLPGLWPPPSSAPWFAALGAAVLAACFAGLRRLPHRMLFAALLLAGWGWAVPFRGAVAFHEYEAMFHVGFPLVLYALALAGLRRLLGPERASRALPALALAAAAVFALSAWDMGRVGHGAEAAAHHRDATADFRAMRDLATGRSVLVSAVRRPPVPTINQIGYWLSDSYLQRERFGSREEWARASRYDYVVLRADLGGSLTPGNRRYFLHRTSDLPRLRALMTAREPALRAPFDLRLDGRALTYVRDGCAAEDAAAPFFLEAVPAGGGPARRLGFAFRDRGVRFDGACIARAELPDEPLAGLRTGQRIGGLPPLWEASIPVADPAFPLRAASWRDAFAGREPAVRAVFDVHLDGRTLTYVRDGCDREDTEARFFLHVVPLDAGDLPAERRESGFGNLDFAFADRGARYGGTCMASAELPDYGIALVRTGQFSDDARLWDAEFAFPGGE